MFKIRALVTATALVAGLGVSAGAQIVSDGGFEMSPIPGYVYNPVTTHWTFVGGSGLINGFNTAWNTPAPVSGQGSQVAFLQANARRAWGVITTTVTLPTSGNYYLSFLNAGRGMGWGGETVFDVLLGSTQIGQFTSSTDEAWSQKGTQFYSDAGTYELSFTTDTKLPGDNTTFFDNVEIDGVASVTAAPEPASLALMLTGLVGVAGVAVRRKRTS